MRLEESYAHCRRIARRRARNFYYSFLALDRARRDAICAVYAFMRRCDDLSDDPDSRGAQAARAGLRQWREELDAALGPDTARDPIWPAFRDTVDRYRIPHVYFHEMIDGVGSDLDRREMDSFQELYRYCYQVASVAGLATIHIFGFRSAQALELAEKCGVAFQLTNILRDLREDAARGRIYIPREDLTRFGVDARGFARGTGGAGFPDLLRFEVERARGYYRESAPLLDLVETSCRGSLWTLIRIYWRLLERIGASGEKVLSRRIRLSAAEKSWILLRGLGGGSTLPDQR